MFVSAKGKQQMWVRQLQCQGQCIDHITYYISGLSRAHFSSRNSCIHLPVCIKRHRLHRPLAKIYERNLLSKIPFFEFHIREICRLCQKF